MAGALLTVVAAWNVAVTPSSVIRAEPTGPAIPTTVQAEPAPEWNAQFAGQEGWIGGDGACSVVLGPRHILWLFGDTLLGTVQDGRRPGAAMVNNTVGVQTGLGKEAAIRFLSGKAKAGKPTAFFTPAEGKGWLWPQAGVRVGDRLYLFLAQLEKKEEKGPFGFRQVGQWLAVVDNLEDDPEKWRLRHHRIPFAKFEPGRERSWGSAVLAEGEYLYVYGYAERGKGVGQRHLTVARVPAAKPEDFAAWRFRTAEGWGDQPDNAALLAGGLATEFSVSRVPGQKEWVAVYVENGLGERIVGRFAEAPEGPWSEPVLLYACPEMGKDKGVFTYSAKAHSWAAGEGLLVSYCVNAWDFARLFRDEAVYRPKFVRVQFGPPK